MKKNISPKVNTFLSLIILLLTNIILLVAFNLPFWLLGIRQAYYYGDGLLQPDGDLPLFVETSSSALFLIPLFILSFITMNCVSLLSTLLFDKRRFILWNGVLLLVLIAVPLILSFQLDLIHRADIRDIISLEKDQLLPILSLAKDVAIPRIYSTLLILSLFAFIIMLPFILVEALCFLGLYFVFKRIRSCVKKPLQLLIFGREPLLALNSRS